jgi:hypothetical protein
MSKTSIVEKIECRKHRLLKRSNVKNIDCRKDRMSITSIVEKIERQKHRLDKTSSPDVAKELQWKLLNMHYHLLHKKIQL